LIRSLLWGAVLAFFCLVGRFLWMRTPFPPNDLRDPLLSDLGRMDLLSSLFPSLRIVYLLVLQFSSDYPEESFRSLRCGGLLGAFP